MPSRSGFPFAKTVTVLASIFGIALGMCGLNYLLLFGLGAARGGSAKLAQFVGPVAGVLGFIELAAMLITAPLLVITVIAWIISGAFASRGGSAPQRLLDDSHNESEKEDDRNKP